MNHPTPPTTTAASRMVDFLEARLNEAADDATRGYLNAPELPDYKGWDKSTTVGLSPAAATLVLADIEAKRCLIANWRSLVARIAAEEDPDKRDRYALTRHGLDMAMFQHAAVYRTHPDYEPGWTP